MEDDDELVCRMKSARSDLRLKVADAMRPARPVIFDEALTRN